MFPTLKQITHLFISGSNGKKCHPDFLNGFHHQLVSKLWEDKSELLGVGAFLAPPMCPVGFGPVLEAVYPIFGPIRV